MVRNCNKIMTYLTILNFRRIFQFMRLNVAEMFNNPTKFSKQIEYQPPDGHC